LAVEQALGGRVVLLSEIVAAGGCFGEADLGRAAVEPDLLASAWGSTAVSATACSSRNACAQGYAGRLTRSRLVDTAGSQAPA
jgi:hypothetical protein